MFGLPFTSSRFRSLKPDERRLLLAHLSRLSADDLYRRFLTFVDARDLMAHIETPHPDREVIGWFRNWRLRGAIEIFYDGDHAEAGVTVEAPYRGQGIGTELVRRGLARARRRGVTGLGILGHRGDYAMLSIAGRFGGMESDGHGRIMEGVAIGDDPLAVWFMFEPQAVDSRPAGLLRRVAEQLGA